MAKAPKVDRVGQTNKNRAGLSLAMIKQTVDGKIPAKQGTELAKGVLQDGKW